jgi:enoyl-CoA hydratase
LGQNTFSSFSRLDIPVIAAINGFALGGGLELAMGCDFRIASSKAKFGQPEVNLGLIPGYAGTQRLSRLVGLGDALYLLMTADMIGAEDALRIGLVQKVVEPELLMEEVMKIAGNIASKGPQAIKKVKKAVRLGFEMSLNKGEELEAEEFGTLFGDGKEGKEGMKAFLEKRKPEW